MLPSLHNLEERRQVTDNVFFKFTSLEDINTHRRSDAGHEVSLRVSLVTMEMTSYCSAEV